MVSLGDDVLRDRRRRCQEVLGCAKPHGIVRIARHWGTSSVQWSPQKTVHPRPAAHLPPVRHGLRSLNEKLGILRLRIKSAFLDVEC